MKTPSDVKEGDPCVVVGGTRKGKSGTVKDRNTSRTRHVTITGQHADGERFKTLARHVTLRSGD